MLGTRETSVFISSVQALCFHAGRRGLSGLNILVALSCSCCATESGATSTHGGNGVSSGRDEKSDAPRRTSTPSEGKPANSDQDKKAKVQSSVTAA